MRKLVAQFDVNRRVIDHAISSYRHDGGEQSLEVQPNGQEETFLVGDAQAVMEVIGHVSRSGHASLKQVIHA
jgi:hypothetical protein